MISGARSFSDPDHSVRNKIKLYAHSWMVNYYLIGGNYNIEHYGYFAYRTITNVAHVSSASQELAEGLFLVLPLQNNTLRGKC